MWQLCPFPGLRLLQRSNTPGKGSKKRDKNDPRPGQLFLQWKRIWAHALLKGKVLTRVWASQSSFLLLICHKDWGWQMRRRGRGCDSWVTLSRNVLIFEGDAVFLFCICTEPSTLGSRLMSRAHGYKLFWFIPASWALGRNFERYWWTMRACSNCLWSPWVLFTDFSNLQIWRDLNQECTAVSAWRAFLAIMTTRKSRDTRRKRWWRMQSCQAFLKGKECPECPSNAGREDAQCLSGTGSSCSSCTSGEGRQGNETHAEKPGGIAVLRWRKD